MISLVGFRMPFVIVQQEQWSGLADNRRKIKVLAYAPARWFVATNGNHGQLYWPPTEISQSKKKKIIRDPGSKPDQSWECQPAVLKRANIDSYDDAARILKDMTCKS